MTDGVFLKACRREPTSYTPVWLMRQAGRYMKDYRAIREKTPFLEICKNKDLVAEITITARNKLGTDAAIIFADILLILESFGLELRYVKGNGPSVQRVGTLEDIEKIPEINPAESLSYLMEAIALTRKSLRPEIPLIGFAGAPFTLASYMIEGGPSKEFKRTKDLMRGRDGAWKMLMAKITRATILYLKAQIEAGVQAVQIFDSWAGCLSAGEYEKYVYPHSQQVISGLQGQVPVIHFGTGTGAFLETFSRAGGDVVSVDHEVSLGEAWRRIGYDRAIQGNLDPTALLGSAGDIRSEVERILAEAGGRPGHIFNLGHGVLPDTPEENVTALVEMVHEMSAR